MFLVYYGAGGVNTYLSKHLHGVLQAPRTVCELPQDSPGPAGEGRPAAVLAVRVKAHAPGCVPRGLVLFLKEPGADTGSFPPLRSHSQVTGTGPSHPSIPIPRLQAL